MWLWAMVRARRKDRDVIISPATLPISGRTWLSQENTALAVSNTVVYKIKLMLDYLGKITLIMSLSQTCFVPRDSEGRAAEESVWEGGQVPDLL